MEEVIDFKYAISKNDIFQRLVRVESRIKLKPDNQINQSTVAVLSLIKFFIQLNRY